MDYWALIGTVKQASIQSRVEFLSSQMAVNAGHSGVAVLNCSLQGATNTSMVAGRGHKVAQKVTSAYTASIYPQNL